MSVAFPRVLAMSYGDITPEELARCVRRARSTVEVLSLLGINNSGGRRAGMRRKIDELGLDTAHFRRTSRIKYTSDLLSAAVAASTSINGVLDHLKIRRSGGAHSHISRRIKAEGIDTSHFSHEPENQHVRGELFERAVLEEAASGAKSMRDILRRLGLTECGRVREDVRHQAARSRHRGTGWFPADPPGSGGCQGRRRRVMLGGGHDASPQIARQRDESQARAPLCRAL